jgi:hypothetical protein
VHRVIQACATWHLPEELAKILSQVKHCLGAAILLSYEVLILAFLRLRDALSARTLAHVCDLRTGFEKLFAGRGTSGV